MWPFRRLSMILILYLSLDVAIALCLSMSPRRWGSRSASSFSVDASVQTPTHCVVQHDAATQLPLTEFFIGCVHSNSPLDRHLRQQCRVHMFYLSHRLDSNSQSLLLSLVLVRTCSPTLAALLAIPSVACQTPCTHSFQRQKECPCGNP